MADGGDYGGRYGATAGNGPGNKVARRKFDKAQQEGGKAALVRDCALFRKVQFRLLLVIRCVAAVLYRGWGADWRNLNGDWWKLMAPHGGLFVLLIPGAITRYWVTW